MTLEDLWEVARANVDGSRHWAVSQGINEKGGGWAAVQIHCSTAAGSWVERSIHRSVYDQGGSQRALEVVALAIVEGKWTVHEAPPAPPAPISPQEAA